ncbi:hypothetical protein ID866_5655 [Astraeus odoratus]|nr:hypothetical protein ID866_5655 [Astraeus odoratus]
MAITPAQKSAIEEIIDLLVAATPPRGKRQLAAMFLELVDRNDWPEYYEVIPEPRCINSIRANVEKNRYKDPLVAYTDISLVFWNALFYNEPGSQIATDAETLKNILVTEWQKRSVLPNPRLSPPPASPQKVHRALASVPPPMPPPSGPSAAKSKPAPEPVASSAKPGPSSQQQHQQHQQASSPEMDVDVSVTSPDPDPDPEPEPEGQSEEAGANSASGEGEDDGEAIIRQLEKSLPRWEGFGDSGWMSPEMSKDRFVDLVVAIKSHKDIMCVHDGPLFHYVTCGYEYNLPAEIVWLLLSMPFRRNQHLPFCLIRAIWACSPPTDGANFSIVGNDDVKRLYQALTSSSPPSGPPYLSTTNFASIRAGPGTARPLHSADTEGVPGVTTFRVSNKDRTFVDEVNYKGWGIRLADWLHLSNPDDPSRPIVGHVFRCWLSDDPFVSLIFFCLPPFLSLTLSISILLPRAKKGQAGVTVCWYYRPEQVNPLPPREPNSLSRAAACSYSRNALPFVCVIRRFIPRIPCSWRRKSSRQVR